MGRKNLRGCLCPMVNIGFFDAYVAEQRIRVVWKKNFTTFPFGQYSTPLDIF